MLLFQDDQYYHTYKVLASTAFLNSLSDEDREIFDRLIKESTEEEFETFKQDIEVAKKDAEEAGTQFCYPDTNELRERCMPLLNKIAKSASYPSGTEHGTIAICSAPVRINSAIAPCSPNTPLG